jgi:membrane-bound lytic murein transglycosylase D
MRRNLPIVVFLASACAGGARAPVPAHPVGDFATPAADDLLEAASPVDLLSETADSVAAPEATVAGFPGGVLASDFDLPITHNARVQNYIDLMTVRHRKSAETWLTRQGRYDAMIEERLRAAGLPLTLKYLPFVESGYMSGVTSHASAVGLWQFVAGTARMEGLEVSERVDDRVDPLLSTDAAIKHLTRLHKRYENWSLALAAYNSGMGRVDRALGAAGVSAQDGDSAFWAIHDQLPDETRDYFPFFVAASVVSRYPALFGFGHVVPDTPRRWDEVTIPDETELAVVARLLNVPAETIAALNPRYIQGVTPRGRKATLRVPEGTAQRFTVAYADLPAEKRVTVRYHVVRRGETLSGIAQRYGVSAANLQQTNRIRRPEALQVGARLRVPGTGSAVVPVSSRSAPKEVVHRVESGESIWTIAQRYGVRAEDLLSWNGLRKASVIHPGDRIRVRTR